MVKFIYNFKKIHPVIEILCIQYQFVCRFLKFCALLSIIKQADNRLIMICPSHISAFLPVDCHLLLLCKTCAIDHQFDLFDC